MKKYLSPICFFLCFNIASAQKIFFSKANYNDTLLFEKNAPMLAKQLIAVIPKNDKAVYYGKLCALKVVTGEYVDVAPALNNFGLALYGDSVTTRDIGFGMRVYAAAMLARPANKADFDNRFQTIFIALYNTLVRSSKTFVEGDYTANMAASKVQFNDKLKSLKGDDSVSVNDASTLCRFYCNYKIYRETHLVTDRILKKIEADNYIIADSVLVKMPDGATIALCVVRDRNVTQPQPVLLTYNIYAGRETGEAKDMVQHGYVGVVANTRGKRLSPDAIEPFEHDAKDAYYIIDWISKQSWCNGKVGMFGGSYLGFSQWSATKYLHPALKTIVPQASVGIGIDYPVNNGVFMTYSLRWLHYVMNNKLIDRDEFANAKKWGNLFNRWYKNGNSFRSLDTLDGRPNAIFQRWLKHPSYDSFWQNMVPQQSEFAKINIPIFTTTGYFDDDQIGAMSYYKQYHKWNKNPNYYLLIGPYNHGGSQAFPSAELGGYKIDSVANVTIIDVVYQWFDHILKGAPLRSILQDKVNFEVMGENKWHHVSGLSQMHNSILKLYLGNTAVNKRYALLAGKPAKPGYIAQTVDLTTRDAVNVNFEVNSDDKIIDSVLKPKDGRLVFVSKPLDKPFAISGAFNASIIAAINKKDMDITIQMYEQTADGKYMAFLENIQRASYTKDKTKRQLLIPGKPETINISNTYILSKLLHKGSRLVVVLGVNKSPEWQVNYGSGKDVSDETMLDAAVPMKVKWYNSSFIEIPVLK